MYCIEMYMYQCHAPTAILLACCQGSKPVFKSFSDTQCVFLEDSRRHASFYSNIGKYMISRIDLMMHIINCVYANSINDYLGNSIRWI